MSCNGALLIPCEEERDSKKEGYKRQGRAEGETVIKRKEGVKRVCSWLWFFVPILVWGKVFISYEHSLMTNMRDDP